MSIKIKITDDIPFSLLAYNKDFIKLKSERLIEKSNLMYSKRQTFRLQSDVKFANYDQWVDFLNTNFASINDVSNHNCDVILPSDNYDITDFDDFRGTPTYDVRNSFNYQAKDYFEAANKANERELPSFYLDKFRRGSFYNVLNFRKKDYFENFARFAINGVNFRSLEEQHRHKNIFFPSKYSYFLSNEIKDEFPIYNEISFNTIDRLVSKNQIGTPQSGQKGLFKNALSELDFYELFIQNYDLLNKQARAFRLQGEDIVSTLATSTLDLFQMLSSLTFDFPTNNRIMLNQEMPVDSSYSRNMKSLILFGKIRDISKAKTRGYDDILDLKESEYEFLFYKVEKRLNDSNGTLLQKYIIPATEPKVNLVDTQIGINKTYHYNVKGYAIIYGSRYSTISVTPQKVGDIYYADLVMETTPSYQIVEIPVFSKSVDTRQPAPLRPFVRFINEKNSNSKIKIYLDLAKGEEHSSLQSVMPADAQQEGLMARVRAREILYHYKYTKEPGEFEIFRMTKPPKFYTDFGNSRLGSFGNPNGSTSMVFHDYIVPNKKYYYIFRAVNGFGISSNPTAIYEIELLKDADDSRLSVELYNMDETEIQYGSKSFKDFFQIEPSTQQAVYIEPEGRLTPARMDNISLGIAEKPIWGKKFKIRLKSKATGKKMDFNVLFNLVTEKSEENFG